MRDLTERWAFELDDQEAVFRMTRIDAQQAGIPRDLDGGRYVDQSRVGMVGVENQVAGFDLIIVAVRNRTARREDSALDVREGRPNGRGRRRALGQPLNAAPTASTSSSTATVPSPSTSIAPHPCSSRSAASMPSTSSRTVTSSLPSQSPGQTIDGVGEAVAVGVASGVGDGASVSTTEKVCDSAYCGESVVSLKESGNSIGGSPSGTVSCQEG